MAEATETGIKWWMRYVIVPLIGGAGVFGIVIAYIDRPRTEAEKPSAPALTLPAAQEPFEPKKTEADKPQVPVRVAPTVRPTEAVITPQPRVESRAATSQEREPESIPEKKREMQIQIDPMSQPEPEVVLILESDHGQKSNRELKLHYMDQLIVVWQVTGVPKEAGITLRMIDADGLSLLDWPLFGESGRKTYNAESSGTYFIEEKYGERRRRIGGSVKLDVVPAE
jgi:hypothetical protein